MKKSRIVLILVLMLLIVLTTLYFYFYSLFTYDAAWNYGFAYNIYKGLVPYKDFNMILTPLFSYLLSIFIFIFGHKLSLYYSFMAILIVAIVYLCYRKIGFKAISIYMLLLVVNEIGYNVFALFLFMVLLYLLEDKDNDIVIAIIISLMILTKQTLGLLIIPSIMYSKKRKKTIMVYVVVALMFLVYLLINNSLFQFMDYCFFGMFDFTGNASKFTMVTLFEMFVCIGLVVGIVKSKAKNKDLLYLLFFQIVAFPITDAIHFIIAFVPVLYYIFYKKNYSYINFAMYVLILSFFVAYNYNYLRFNSNNDVIYQNKSSFMDGKRMQRYLVSYFKFMNNQINNYSDYRLYILESRAYLVKLELGIKINKYDLINNGNMGYKGDFKYIDEIDNYCKKNKCVFFINENTKYFKEIKQRNKNIVSYVTDKYSFTNKSLYDNIYSN